MKFFFLVCLCLGLTSVYSLPQFSAATPQFTGSFNFKAEALCATAKETLAYLNKGTAYDPATIHEGKLIKIPVERVKATLIFICKHQAQLDSPKFVKEHFDFIRWYPDLKQVEFSKKPLLANLSKQHILMTKYYVHLAQANSKYIPEKPYPLYALPKDESHLTLAQANNKPDLIRFKYGKQAILKGALEPFNVPKLAYLNREDLEAALLQGTVVADFGKQVKKIFNVHRNNNIAYNRVKPPYEQERFWYFKEVAGIKGYGKDADYKITVNPEVTFAADLNQFGLGKVLMIQYQDKSKSWISRAGIMADTGGAFANNAYQIDYLAGNYADKQSFTKGTRHLPDYVHAYFMVLKK